MHHELQRSPSLAAIFPLLRSRGGGGSSSRGGLRAVGTPEDFSGSLAWPGMAWDAGQPCATLACVLFGLDLGIGAGSIIHARFLLVQFLPLCRSHVALISDSSLIVHSPWILSGPLSPLFISTPSPCPAPLQGQGQRREGPTLLFCLMLPSRESIWICRIAFLKVDSQPLFGSVLNTVLAPPSLH